MAQIDQSIQDLRDKIQNTFGNLVRQFDAELTNSNSNEDLEPTPQIQHTTQNFNTNVINIQTNNFPNGPVDRSPLEGSSSNELVVDEERIARRLAQREYGKQMKQQME